MRIKIHCILSIPSSLLGWHNSSFPTNHSRKKNLIKHRKNCIKVGHEELKENKLIFNEFKRAAIVIDKVKDSGLRDEDLRKVHLRVIKFAFLLILA